MSLPFVGRVSYEVLAAGAEISRVGDFGFGPIVEGEHKFKFGEFEVYNGAPMELDSTGSGLVNFTMRSTGPPSFDWNPQQLIDGQGSSTFAWTEAGADTLDKDGDGNTTETLTNWFEDSGRGLETGHPGLGAGTLSAAKIVRNITGPNLSKPKTIETLQVGPARTLEVKPDPASPTRTVLTVNGLFENAGSVQIRGDSAIQLGSRESVMCGIGSVTLLDGGAIVGSSQENPAVCNYNGIYGSGHAFDQTFSFDENIRSINHNMGELLAYGGTGTTGGNSVDVSITADNFPGDITWTITTSDGAPIANGAAGAANTTTTVTVPLPDGDYNFTFSDSEGDGGGSYTLYSSIGQPLASGADVTTEVRPFYIYNGPFLKTGAYTMLNMAEYGSRTGGRMVINADNMDNQTGSKITAIGVGAETHVRSREVEHGATVEAKAGGKVILYPRSEESLVTWRAGRSFREDCGLFRASDNGVIHAQSGDMYGGCFIANGTGSITTNNSVFTAGVFEIGSLVNPTGLFSVTGPSPFSNIWRPDTFTRFDRSCINNYGTFRVSNQGEAEIFDSELFANHGTVQVDFGSRMRIHTVTSDLAGASADSQIQPGCANMTNTALLGGTWDIAGVLDVDGIGTNGNTNFKVIGADLAPARISSATRGDTDPSPAVFDPETTAYITANPNETPELDALKRPFDTTKILSEGSPAHVIFRGGGASFNALSTVELNCGKISIIDGGRFRPLGDFVNKGELVIGRVGGTGSSTFEARNAGSFTQIGRNASTTILDGGLHRISSASGVPKRFNILGGTFTNSRTTGSFHMFQDRMLADAHVRIESPMDDLNPDPDIYEQAPVTVDIGGTVATIDAGAEVTIHGATVHFDALKDNLRTIKGKFTLSGDGPINAPEWRIAEGNGEALALVGGQLNVLGFGTELKTGDYSQTLGAETRVGVGACFDTRTIAVNAVNGGKFVIEIGARPDQIPSGCLKVRSNIGANFNGQFVIDFVDELAASNSTIDIGDTWEIIDPVTSASITGIASFEARLDGDLLLPGDAWLPPGSQLELIQYVTSNGPRGLAVRVTPTAGFFAFNDWTTANGLDYNRAEADPFRFTTASSANNVTSFLYGVNGTSKFTASQGQGLSLFKGEGDDEGTYAQLSYTRPFGTDATYAYYLSRDLIEWQQAPMIFVPGGTPPQPGELEMVTLRTTVPVSEDQLFMRVGATLNPDNFQDGEIPGKKITRTGGLRGFSPSGTTYLMEPGKELFFDVSIPNGESGDTVWGGTDPTTGERNFIYQDKSGIKLAALHSGLLLEGERGMIKVTLIAPQPSFTGSLQNDGTDSKITSGSGLSEGEAYSYRIELISKQ